MSDLSRKLAVVKWTVPSAAGVTAYNYNDANRPAMAAQQIVIFIANHAPFRSMCRHRARRLVRDQ